MGETIRKNSAEEVERTPDNTNAGRHKTASGTVCPGINNVPVVIPGVSVIRNCARSCGAQFKWKPDRLRITGQWICVTPKRRF